MATYYCDLAADYTDATGVNHTGNEYTGVGGWQAAIRGTGNATALAAGDTLYVNGTGKWGRLVVMDCGADVSATGLGWALGDEVRNKDGAGDDWTGVICQLSVGADVQTILVELDAAYTSMVVADADGIENTTQSESCDPLDSHSCPGIQIDTASGDHTSGHIKIIGCAADWSTGNGATTYCATLDGQSVATNCMYAASGIRYVWLENLIWTAASSDNAASASYQEYWVFRYIHSTLAGRHGIGAACFYRSAYYHCVFESATLDAADKIGTADGYVYGCIFRDSGDDGIYLLSGGSAVVNCVITGNTGHGIEYINEGSITGSIIDGNDGAGIYLITSHKRGSIHHCRISNNGAYGINLVSGVSDDMIEDYNVFYNNTTAERNNIVAGANSRTAASAAECGYTVWSCTISYDGGTDMDLVNVGDAITDGSWTGTVKSISDNGDGTGTLSIETLSGGLPANNDAFTAGAGNAVVDGTFSIDATTDYALTAAAIMAGTDAEAIKLDWTTTPDHTGYYTAGIPRRYSGFAALSPRIHGV